MDSEQYIRETGTPTGASGGCTPNMQDPGFGNGGFTNHGQRRPEIPSSRNYLDQDGSNQHRLQSQRTAESEHRQGGNTNRKCLGFAACSDIGMSDDTVQGQKKRAEGRAHQVPSLMVTKGIREVLTTACLRNILILK